MIEKTIIQTLTKRKLTLSVAESCTGGLIAHALTNIPGSSKVLKLGIIAYSNDAKISILNISPAIIEEHGAVSKETALALAQNVKHLGQTNIGLGITGIAGPGGGSPAKPVGTVFISLSIAHNAYFKKFLFRGSRLRIKTQAKDAALKLLKECLC